ncbi:MAG: SUMF1/EgtB/PvdO family nonheme iron enzyme [SAR324 cluster bacterium]|nr:SUMF1/EgtB/PvdO family nonheme iron enzyme [SAR324 cluster bacterium]
MSKYILIFCLVFFLTASLCSGQSRIAVTAEKEQLFLRIQQSHHLNESQTAALRHIFFRSPVLSQGNPAITHHPVTRSECEQQRKDSGLIYENPEFEKICGSPYMAPLYDPSKNRPEEAKACVDQFEFPDIPCEYPVVWVRAKEAAEICSAMGKRLCDAHEWEGACAGALEDADYRFDLVKEQTLETSIRQMREAHNRKHGPHKNWSYGSQYQTGICGANSVKDEKCEGGQWNTCGSNTYPTGFFAKCKSLSGVYDLNGNAAEHMNLPLAEQQMSSKGSTQLGYTEMKGSWFIFDKYKAHEDWCRWRAPFWHGSKVMDPDSHHNYHLGFRCCKTL